MRNFVIFIYILVKGRNAVDTIDCPGTSNGETPDICVVQRSQKLSLNCVTDQLQEEIINSNLQGNNFNNLNRFNTVSES